MNKYVDAHNNMGNSVYLVLKKYRLREERLELLNREYELEWGTMEVNWEKN